MRTRAFASVVLSLFTAACLPPSLSPLPVTAPPIGMPFRIQAVGPTVYTAFPATNGQPSDFKDATTDVSPIPAWLYSGKWARLASQQGFSGGVFHQDETGPYPHVSIRRYSGTTFGQNGVLPPKYRISLAIQPFAQADHMPPIGENGVLVYYRNPTNYVELVVSGGNVAVWSAQNSGPTSSSGWTGHHWFGQKTAIGEIRRLSAEIDTNAHTISYWVEGNRAASLTIPFLANTPGHTFALRSIGNKLNVGEIRIEDLSGGGTSPPSPGPTPTPTPAPSPQPTATSKPSATPPAGQGISFQSVGSMPKGLVWHGAAAKGSTVYLSGGSNGSASFTGVWSSPAGAWSWQDRTSLPKPTEGHGFTIIGSYAYVIGGWGRNVGGPRPDVLKAAIAGDGSLGPWQATTPLPQGRAFPGVVTDGNRIILLGGWGPGYSSQTPVWSATADGAGNLSAWQSGPALPDRRAWAGAAITGGKLWVTGGSSGSKTMATTFQASYSNGQIGSWQSGPSLPGPLEAQATVVWGGALTTIGGDDYSTGTPSPTNAAYQLIGGLWKTIGNLPFAGFGQVPVLAGGKLYLFGGHDAAHNVLSGVWQGS
ncbi:MAG: hypothetical protein H7338_21710 [Candidatus Sericytochromatia bacterium]|nr:hypothetical protein [Candidatus Sericytochromatia bacterium]